MMKQKTIMFNWKNVLMYFLLFLIVLVVIYFFLLYRQIGLSKETGFKEAEQFVLANADIEKINNITYFQEEEGYIILEGEDKKAQTWFIYLPDEKNPSVEKMKLVSFKDNKSQEEIESLWFNECNQCTLIRSVPALVNNKPMWEITYTDHANRYVIEYRLFTDGTTYEQLRLSTKYKEG